MSKRVKKKQVFESLESLTADLEQIPLAERAWAAGFFDGEGCFTVRRVTGRQWQLILTITNTEPAAIDRFRAAVGGGGKIYVCDRGNTKWKVAYKLNIVKKRDLWRAAWVLIPFLGIHKKRQFIKCFDLVEENKKEGSRRINSVMRPYTCV